MPLLSLSICYEMVHATSQFRDEINHVVRFGDREIVPLFEEVEGLIGLPSNGPIITTRYPTRISVDLSTILYLPQNLYDNYLQYDEVRLLNLLLTFQFGT